MPDNSRVVSMCVSHVLEPNLLYACQYLADLGWACGRCGYPCFGDKPKAGQACKDCGATITRLERYTERSAQTTALVPRNL